MLYKSDSNKIVNHYKEHLFPIIIPGWAELDIWEDRKIRLPVPVEPILKTMYGEEWREPKPQWIWDKDPYK